MRKILIALLVYTSFIHSEKITILFREPFQRQDVQKIHQAVARSRAGDPQRIGIVVKRTSIIIQGAKAPLHTIAMNIPFELHRCGDLDGKMARVMHLDATIITDKEADRLVWDIKDVTKNIWKVFRGTRMHTALDVPFFDPRDVYDVHGNFRQEVVAHFYSLPMSAEERANTHELIDKMGTTEWYALLWYKSHMEKLGNAVDRVHPLRFTGFIFADQHLKKCMREVREFNLKWSRFLEGFSQKMELNFSQRNLLLHLPGFCVETGADYNEVLPLLEAQNWKGFLDYMIYR